MNRYVSFISIIVLALAGVGFISVGGPADSIEGGPRPIAGGRLPIQGEGGIAAAAEDFTGELVPVLERDTIPALDFPPFTPIEQVRGHLDDDDLVLGVVVEGDARAYPLRVMAAHEVVNDEIGGKPVVVTFCPLCFTGVAYDRRVDGDTRSFGVSGFLLNSSLVMFDRERETLWSQVTGTALNGQEKGATLSRVAALQTEFSTWIDLHPDTLVLDVPALGGDDRYPAGRFESYFSSSAAGLIPLTVRDDLPQKALVAGVLVEGMPIAFEIDPDRQRVEVAEIAGERIVVWIDGPASTATGFRSPGDDPMTFVETSAGQFDLVAPASGGPMACC